MGGQKKDPRERPAELKTVPLNKVEIDRSTQARVRKNPERVKELTELLEGGGKFKDDIEVYFDGWTYWVGDGFHRLEAYQNAGRERVPALVREGVHRDAMVHAAGANAEHGLPRKREDVRRAIRLLLEDDEIARLSDRTVAQLARCDGKTVGAVSESLGKNGDNRVYTDRHGNVAEMDVSGLKERAKKAVTFNAKVNTFHDLPPPVRGVLKDVLRVASGQDKAAYSFVLSWLKGHLPPSPKEAGHLLTELELEEKGEQENGEGEDIRF